MDEINCEPLGPGPKTIPLSILQWKCKYTSQSTECIFFGVKVHIYNYAYSFGDGRRRKIKRILVYLIGDEQAQRISLGFHYSYLLWVCHRV